MRFWIANAVLVLAYTAYASVSGHDKWTYSGEAGPDQWPNLGFTKCAGERQSPINVVTNRVIPKRFKPISFNYFDQIPLTLNLSNNYHSATARMTWEKVPMIKDGGLPGRYEVINFHFHWGRSDFKGSEHTIDGESYPLEMHIVCQNTKYKELSEAVLHPDGLAVLGVMYELSDTNSRAIRSLEPALRNITAGGATVELEDPPRLLELMPWNTVDFYRYEGSLTTPGCHEAVTWTIFLHPVRATEEQLELFRALRREPGPIGYNYRPPQRRHGRSVYLNRLEDDERAKPKPSEPRTSGAARPPSGAAPLLALLLLRLAAC